MEHYFNPSVGYKWPSIIQCGWTGLMWASERSYTASMRVLLEAQGDPNITNEVKFHYSYSVYNSNWVHNITGWWNCCLSSCPKGSCRNSQNVGWLWCSSWYQRQGNYNSSISVCICKLSTRYIIRWLCVWAIVNFLLCVLSTIQNGYTSLMRASGGDSIDTVRVLLEAKADPNISTEVKLHCLYWL